MGLTIVPNAHAPDVAALLRRICPDPQLSIAFGPVTVPDPDGGSPVTMTLPGTVTYVPNSSISKSCDRLAKLVAAPDMITIEMIEAGTTVKTSTGLRAIETLAAFTNSTTLHKLNSGWGRIEILLDASNAAGNGYWAEDNSGTHIDLDLDVALAHELGHAEQYLTSEFSGLSEPLATDAENDYRSERSLPLRNRTSHNGGRKTPAASSTPPTTYKPRSCFIATAALGSSLAPEVVMLRSMRDNILRKTRVGAAACGACAHAVQVTC